MKFRFTKKRLITALLIVAAISCAAVYINHQRNAGNQLAVSQAAATKLPTRSPNVPQLFLAKGLLPPTNKWFSSLAFSNQSQPVYAYPLSFATSSTGYSISAPPVVSSTNAVFATHIADISVDMNTPNHIVTNYDDLSVSVGQQQANGQTVAITRITHGSPYVFSDLEQATHITISTTGTITSLTPHQYAITIGGRLYGLYTSDQALVQGQSVSVSGTKGGLLSLFAIPNANVENEYFADASHEITSTLVTYKTSDQTMTTNYQLTTKGGSTLFAITPVMNVKGHTGAGTFTTILGKQKVLSGNTFSDVATMPAMPSPQLPLNNITAAERKDLIAKLTTDTASLNFTQTDTYFGGKELYRAANLLELAENLNQPQLANTIKTKLAARLSEWLNPDGANTRDNLYFYYDTTYHGVVGVQASYGSDVFNDHDFHYGYFIYASAILSQYDHAFYTQNAPMVNVLISDIAATQATNLFPKLRYFDSYVGHSWASGNGNFSDGNNQESSSEAINAWYGMYLWSQVSHNQALASESEWLYAHEVKSAQTQWLGVKNPAINGPNYAHPTAGIIWGDKIDYSTFFSPRPQAVLGIQLIPMSPGQAYLNQTNVNQNIASVISTPSDLDGQFHDYLIMYQALSNPKLALQEAATLSPQDLDNGNSMTYLYAWLYSHQN